MKKLSSHFLLLAVLGIGLFFSQHLVAHHVPSCVITGILTGTPGSRIITPGTIIRSGNLKFTGTWYFSGDSSQTILGTMHTGESMGHVYKNNTGNLIFQDTIIMISFNGNTQGHVDLVSLRGHLIVRDTVPHFHNMGLFCYLVSDSGYGTCTLVPTDSNHHMNYLFPLGNLRTGYVPLNLTVHDTSLSLSRILPSITVGLSPDTTISLTAHLEKVICSGGTPQHVIFTCKQPFVWNISTIDTAITYSAHACLPGPCGALPHRILSFPWNDTLGQLSSPCSLIEWTHSDSTKGGIYRGSQRLSPASGINSVLPLASIELSASSDIRNIRLHANLLGNDFQDDYMLFRSTDGIHFTFLNTLDEVSLHEYADYEIVPGITYYYKIQGTTRYQEEMIESNIAAGQITTDQATISLVPHPADQSCRILSSVPIVQATLFSSSGEQVASFNDPSGIFLIDTHDTPAGYYQVELTSPTEKFHLPLVIIHEK